MLAVEKIKKPSLFTVLFFLVMITMPLTVNAGPPVKCPCFSEGKVIRLADRSPGLSCYSLNPGTSWKLELSSTYTFDSFIAAYDPDYSGNNMCQYSYSSTRGNKNHTGTVFAMYDGITPEEAELCFRILNNICGP